jgi:hypothetical protein
MTNQPLYRQHEPAIRNLYAEVRQRVDGIGQLLPGTPGTVVKRTTGPGHEYWYRSYYPAPKKRVEVLIGRADDLPALDEMQDRIGNSAWIAKQVSTLSKLGFQVADKSVAAVLVEIHNRALFDAGLMVVGTMAYMSWLNEYGSIASAAHTQDIDLARKKTLKLATTVPFLSSMTATHLPFHRIPGLPSALPSTAVKLRGVEALRVDVLAPGRRLGETVEIPELDWHAQTIPHYDYLLEQPAQAAMLAGGHCVPIKLPDAARLLWHKIFSSTRRIANPTKADKDLTQAVTLAAILVEQGNAILRDSFTGAPSELRSAAATRSPKIRTLLARHPQALEEFCALPLKRK